MSNKYIMAIISFFGGVVTGGLGVYIAKMTKYNKDFQKKLKEMEAYYAKKGHKTKPATKKDKETPKITTAERKDMMDEAKKIAAREGYKKHYGRIILDEDDDAIVYEEEDAPIPDDVTSLRPYLIEPNQFGDQEMYEMETWSLYQDGVVTNEEDAPMDEETIENYIPIDALEQLKASDEDSVFVRNESRRTDYQIIKVIGRYADD